MDGMENKKEFPTTTLAELHWRGACVPRYRHLCRALGGARAYGRNTPITAKQIFDLNGRSDLSWALREGAFGEEGEDVCHGIHGECMGQYEGGNCICDRLYFEWIEKTFKEDK